jgi:hypothetical protein
MAKKDEGQKYVESLLALIPEEKRTAVKEALAQDQVYEHVGEHVMARSDYSRAQDQLKQSADAVLGYKSQLDTWYQTVNQELARGSEALRRLESIKGDEPQTDPAATPATPSGLKQEDVEKVLAERIGQNEQQTLGLVAYVTTLAQAHYARYGEPLDVGNLIGESRRVGRPLPQVYEEKTREKREALEAKQAKQEREKLREEVRGELLAEQRKSGHGAYPLPGADADPLGNATLSGLKPATKEGGNGETAYGVRAALDEFYAKGQNIGS